MRIESKDLVEEFYHRYKDSYPNLTEQQFKDICISPWIFLKREMESGELQTVRFKYFGVFQVYIGRAKGLLNSLQKRLDSKSISEEQFKKSKIMLEKFISNEE